MLQTVDVSDVIAAIVDIVDEARQYDDDATRPATSEYARDLARRFYGPTADERDRARGW